MEFHPAQGYATGFPIKDARFSKLKNILFLLSDEKEGNIIENIDFKYLSNRASFMGNPVNSNQLTGAAFVVCWDRPAADEEAKGTALPPPANGKPPPIIAAADGMAANCPAVGAAAAPDFSPKEH